MTVADDLALALELADQADSLTLPRFHALDFRVDTKPDQSLVTEVDRNTEAILRDRLGGVRPGDDVLGEEMGGADRPAGRRWILDPIDGTHNFVRGLPVYATLIALQEGPDLVVGVASAPALGRRWWASRGEGAFADGKPIFVSKIDRLDEATLSFTDILEFERSGLAEPFMALARKCWRSRGLGDFWQHCLLAEGALDITVEPALAPWDIAPVKLIVEEAGGRFTTFDGESTLARGSAVATNGLLHDEVLAALATT
jgi:histidinol-phosphatase